MAAATAGSNNVSGEQRQWRLQRERLHNDFTKALNSFQAAQRTAAQKEKEAIKKAKAAAGGGTLTITFCFAIDTVKPFTKTIRAIIRGLRSFKRALAWKFESKLPSLASEVS